MPSSEEMIELLNATVIAARECDFAGAVEGGRELKVAISTLERERDGWKARAEKAEAERYDAISWIEYHKRQYQALRLEIDALNGALEECAEAEAELAAKDEKETKT